MRKIIASLAVVGLLMLGGTAFAEIGSIDSVPAATLLLPYFEVAPDGQTDTLFSINNASAAPALAHVTLWTDLSRPTLDFDVYLTGYDVVTLSLANLFINGFIPQTGPNFTAPGDEPFDAPSLNAPGEFSDPDVAFPGCAFPLPSNIPNSLLTYIQNLHSGGAAPNGFANSGLCGGVDYGDGNYRGYVTVDIVNECSLEFPGNAAYIGDGGTGIMANDNILWGDYFWVDGNGDFAQGDQLVHIEAVDSVQNGFWTPGDYTFYGRYVSYDASDNREPLATSWAARYFAGTVGVFDNDSDIVCWRDTGRNENGFFACGNAVDGNVAVTPFPLSQNQIVIFDENENPVVVQGSPFSPPPTIDSTNPCPYEATRANASDFGTIFDFGWFYMNLNTTTGSLVDPIKQSFVTEVHSADGRFSVGYQAIHLDSALDKTFTVTTAPSDVNLPVMGGGDVN